MKYVRLAVFAAIGIAVSGCASIVEGTTQSVAVTTTPNAGAKCVLTSSEGVYYVTTPGNAIVHKTKNDMTVTCKADGFQDASLTISPNFNGATAGNIIAGGIIGIGIDAATGANYNFPQAINVPMIAVVPPTPTTMAPSAVTMPDPTPAKTSS